MLYSLCLCAVVDVTVDVNVRRILGKIISNMLHIDFLHGNICDRSCKKIGKCMLLIAFWINERSNGVLLNLATLRNIIDQRWNEINFLLITYNRGPLLCLQGRYVSHIYVTVTMVSVYLICIHFAACCTAYKESRLYQWQRVLQRCMYLLKVILKTSTKANLQTNSRLKLVMIWNCRRIMIINNVYGNSKSHLRYKYIDII